MPRWFSLPLTWVDRLKEDHKGSWTCPRCSKTHSKPHYAFPDQLDTEKDVSQPGKVKYGWEKKCYSDSAPEMDRPELTCESKKMETGPEFDKKGIPSPLFCPHCGWQQEVVVLVKVKSRKK